MGIFVAQPMWLQDLQNCYAQDEGAWKLMTKLLIEKSKGHFTLVQGILKYKVRIWLGHRAQLQKQVISALHASPVGGHSGNLVTH